MLYNAFISLIYRSNRGSGESGHLGHGNDDHCRTPKLVSALSKETIIHVGVGNEHTLVVTAGGELYGWGRNTSGEVMFSREPINSPTLIQGLSNITHVCCGLVEVCGVCDMCVWFVTCVGGTSTYFEKQLYCVVKECLRSYNFS